MKKIQNSILLLLLCSFSALSQENDFQTWTSASINKKLIKKTTLVVKSGLRLRENSTLYSKQFTDVRIKRKYNKYWSFALGYRNATDWNKSFETSVRNRYYADVYFKEKVKKRLYLSVRARQQWQGNRFAYKGVFRQKLALSYNIRKTKLEPSAAVEYFYTAENNVEKLRYTCSLSHPLNKNLDIELGYRIQQEVNTNNPETLFIFEGKIAYDL